MRVKAIAVLTICACLAFCASSDKKTQRAREKDPKYQYNLGLFYINQSNVDEAIKYFVKALSLDARFYQAWNMIGLAHASKGHLEEAVKAYQKSLEINPQFTEVYNNLGTVYQERGQLDKAEAAYKAAWRPNLELAVPGYNGLAGSQQNHLGSPRCVGSRPARSAAMPTSRLYPESKTSPRRFVSYEAAVKIEPVSFAYHSPWLICAVTARQGIFSRYRRGDGHDRTPSPATSAIRTGARPLRRAPLRSLPASRRDTSSARG
jgi:tetratricopeptide (TPR) repeat protein